MSSIKRYHYRLILNALVWLMCLGAQHSWAQEAQESCGPLEGVGGIGVDYTDPQQAGMIATMNRNHFNANVETLVSGMTGSIEGELDFLLRNSPNHHRALYAMAQHHLREGTEKFQREMFSVHCWFDRAMRFAPTDGVVRVVYGIYLHRRKDYAEAERRYKEGIELAPNFAEGHYNIGLLYSDLKRYDDALTHAHEAYRLGYPLPGLKRRLVDAGRWAEPVE